jgi:hypothetical protein
MPNLKPFRDYDEHDVVNLFTLRDQSDVNKGTFVKLTSGQGWVSTDEPFGDTQSTAGSVNYVGRAVSNRYIVQAGLGIAGSGDAPIGMTLYDMKETDENGEKLLFNPQKAAEMQTAISGQAVPVATRGVFLYSGTTLHAATNVAPDAGNVLYAADNGDITTTIAANFAKKVGVCLGAKGSDNYVLIKIDCDPTQ